MDSSLRWNDELKRSRNAYRCALFPSHPERLQDKRVNIRDFLDLLARRLALSVTSARFDTDQLRFAVRIDRLHGRCKLETVRRENAIVMIAGGNHRRRIIHAGLDVVQR